jgi:hypothetical protein
MAVLEQHLGQIRETAALGEPQIEVEILRGREFEPIAAGRDRRRAARHQGRVEQRAAFTAQQTRLDLRVFDRDTVGADRPPLGVDEQDLASEPDAVGVRVEVADLAREALGSRDVVGVHAREQLGARELDAFAQCGR